MKILVVTHYFPSHKGGVEVVAGEIINQLSKNEVEVKWIASQTDEVPENSHFLECFSIPTVNIIEKKFGFAYPLWNLTIYRQLWRQVKQVDLVHLHEYIYLGNILAFYIAKKQGKPVVITQHIGFIPFTNKLFCWLLKLVNHSLGKFILSRCDRTVFCSQVIADYWDNVKVKYREKPAFIPNGVDPNIFYPINEEERLKLREKLNLGKEKIVILFVGRFVEKKGLKLLEKLAKNYYFLFT
jgi:glycosyltransferase involved in cell wall biosynthesis